MANPKDLRQAMEASLAANPDDLATHMAYADHLVEQGDPRGEFIQVQLALEDQRRPESERKPLRLREAELIGKHQAEWIGEATDLFGLTADVKDLNGRFGLDMYYRSDFSFRFARGWLDRLEMPYFSTALAEALGRSPTIGLLRELTILQGTYIEQDDREDNGLGAVAKWPCLGQLRRLQLGPHDNCHTRAENVVPTLRGMARLEELYLYAHRVPTDEVFALPMPNLRKLHVYHVYDYPLDMLGNNPSLGNLVELSCWPHGLEPGDRQAYIQPGPFREMIFSPHLKSLSHLALYLTDLGDEGCRAIVESGVLKRLRVLDLWSGRITDEGARLLAACPDIRHLQRLRIAQNVLTEEGVAALRATGVNLEAEGQMGPDFDEYNEHLNEGDPE
jgi:uncharacterized protein (TIGR02996 family)